MALARLTSGGGGGGGGGGCLFLRFLCAASTESESSPALLGAEFNKAIRSLFKLTDPYALGTRFKELSSSSPHFRSKSSIYRSLILRLVSSSHHDVVSDILEAQKLTPSITHEHFAARIISLYGKAKMPNDADKTFQQLPKLGCPRSFLSLNALLAAFVDSGEYDRAIETFENVPMGIVPDTYSYNIMIHVMCLKGEMERAMEMLGVMEEKGLEATVITYCTLLNGHYNLKNGCNLEEGEKVWEMMREKGCAPDLKCFNAKMRALCFHGKMVEAGEVMELARSSGLEPNSFSYTTLVIGECKTGNLAGAKKVFEEMTRRRCPPNKGTLQAILPSLCEAGELDLALKLCNASVHTRCDVAADVVQRLVDVLVENSRVGDAKNLVEFAWSSGRYSSDSLVMPPACLAD